MGKDMPLCNACGIRWKKYGVVCDECQYVPCKQERENKNCKRCSAPLPPATKRIRPCSPITEPKKAQMGTHDQINFLVLFLVFGRYLLPIAAVDYYKFSANKSLTSSYKQLSWDLNCID